MQKRGQLGIIEGKYAIVGFIVGVLASFALVFLGTKEILPFKIPVVCGFLAPFFKNKKGQLVMIEFQYFMGGFIAGLIVGFVLVYLGSAGVIPFKIPLVCPAVAVK